MASEVRLQLPVVLEPICGCQLLEVAGINVGEALQDAFRQIPALRHHLLSEEGELRPHILCILNGTNLRRDVLSQTLLADGDELLIHQAISGG